MRNIKLLIDNIDLNENMILNDSFIIENRKIIENLEKELESLEKVRLNKVRSFENKVANIEKSPLFAFIFNIESIDKDSIFDIINKLCRHLTHIKDTTKYVDKEYMYNFIENKYHNITDIEKTIICSFLEKIIELNINNKNKFKNFSNIKDSVFNFITNYIRRIKTLNTKHKKYILKIKVLKNDDSLGWEDNCEDEITNKIWEIEKKILDINRQIVEKQYKIVIEYDNITFKLYLPHFDNLKDAKKFCQLQKSDPIEIRYSLQNYYNKSSQTIRKYKDALIFIFQSTAYLYLNDNLTNINQMKLFIKNKHYKRIYKFEKIKKYVNMIEQYEQAKEILTREPIPEKVRFIVWRRDEGKCVKCGSRENLEFDHIIPVSKGGSNSARNIQILCQKCNREKSNNI
jgi:hypothetical protein